MTFWTHDPPHYEPWQAVRCPTCGHQSPPYEWYCDCREEEEEYDDEA